MGPTPLTLTLRVDACAEASGHPPQDVVTLFAKAAGQAGRALVMNFVCAYQLGSCGRPLVSLRQQGELMRVLQHQDYLDKYWTDQGAEQLTDAIDKVLCSHMRKHIEHARFVSITLDEVSLGNNQARMSVHLYYCDKDWQRFVGLPSIKGRPTAEVLFDTLIVSVSSIKGRPTAEVLFALSSAPA